MAAKKHKNSSFVVGNCFDLPFIGDVFDVALSINAPVSGDGISRVLAVDGVYLRIFPGTSHLLEIKQQIYATPKPAETEVIDISPLTHVTRKQVAFTISPTGESIFDLLLMTPFYWHATEQQQRAFREMENLTVSVEFFIDVYRNLIAD